MKKLFVFLSIVMVSCIQKHEINVDEAQSDRIKSLFQLPIGNKAAFDFNYPEKWEMKSSEEIDLSIISPYTELNKLFDINYSFRQSLQIDKTKQKILPPNGIIENSFTYIDTISYFAGYLKNSEKYDIAFFKDGEQKDNMEGNEGCVINYINLVTLTKDFEVLDKLSISVNHDCLVGGSSRVFYIDKNLNIYLKDFKFDEDKYYYKGSNKFHIDSKGKFKSVK